MNRKILIIDDNNINRKYAKALLADSNTDILLAESANEGIDLIKTNCPDILLLDIQMPVIDGFECIKMIKEQFPNYNFPIIAVTAFPDNFNNISFADHGFDDIVQKPIQAVLFKEKVDTWLQRSKNGFHPTNNADNNNANDIIDLNTFKELLKFAPKEDLLLIYDEFAQETCIFLKNLKGQLASNDYEEILIILHTIKGNAGSLGLLSFTKLIEEVELKLEGCGREQQELYIDQLIDLFRNFADNYKRLLNYE